MLTQNHSGNELSLIINSGVFALMEFILKEIGLYNFIYMHVLLPVNLVIKRYSKK